jgi:hypothetical protein
LRTSSFRETMLKWVSGFLWIPPNIDVSQTNLFPWRNKDFLVLQGNLHDPNKIQIPFFKYNCVFFLWLFVVHNIPTFESKFIAALVRIQKQKIIGKLLFGIFLFLCQLALFFLQDFILYLFEKLHSTESHLKNFYLKLLEGKLNK